jgi:hypothetical protein
MITSRVVLHLRALALAPVGTATLEGEHELITGSDVNANTKYTHLEFVAVRSSIIGMTQGTDTELESGHEPWSMSIIETVSREPGRGRI